jgi:hypothetical protein
MLLDNFTAPFGHGNCGIISTGQHESIADLPEGKDIAFLKFSRSASDRLDLLIDN